MEGERRRDTTEGRLLQVPEVHNNVHHPTNDNASPSIQYQRATTGRRPQQDRLRHPNHRPLFRCLPFILRLKLRHILPTMICINPLYHRCNLLRWHRHPVLHQRLSPDLNLLLSAVLPHLCPLLLPTPSHHILLNHCPRRPRHRNPPLRIRNP